MAKNEKGETTSQTVEVSEIPEEEKPKDKKAKGEAPKFSQGLKSSVSSCLACK